MDSVTHFDIPAEDVERAKAFYAKAFGWQINQVPNMDYFMISTTDSDEKGMPKNPGAINGGMFKKTGKPDEFYSITVDVPSVDASIKKVEEAGGKVVMPKQEVGDFGYHAKVKDTEGNAIGLWESKKK